MASPPLMFTALLLILTFTSAESVRHGQLSANSTSQWLDRLQRRPGCRFRPWICLDLFDPFRRCCRNHCVDVGTDPNHCGFCGIRCPFGWQCCHGLCINVMRNPIHCGNCATRCPFGIRCRFGMCGYAESPLPFSPRQPELLPPPPLVDNPPALD